MSTIDQLEAQKAREMLWVDEGVRRFRAHCDRTAEVGGGPKSAMLLKLASSSLTRRMDLLKSEPSEGRSRVVPILNILGSSHLAALTLHYGVLCCFRPRKSWGDFKTATNLGRPLGEAVEHDVKFHRWAKDAEGAEKAAVRRMREDMEKHPKTWRRRVKRLREIVEELWTSEETTTLGMDLLGLAVEASPELFVSPLVRHGHKTVRLFELTADAAEALSQSLAPAEVSSPKWGMMTVKPVPWAYEEAA